MELAGRRVLVTGASRGIGEAIARAFARRGAKLLLAARSADALRALAGELGGEPLPVDLTDPAQVAELVPRAEAAGPLDLLVNDAGVEYTGPYDAMTAEELERLWRVNVVAPAELTRQALARMIPRGAGHVVNVSSLAAIVPFPGLTAYGASKAALSRLTAGLWTELRGTGVGATLVELGGVRTEMLARTRRYEPTRRAWERAERLRLSVDVDPGRVAGAIVHAVERGRRHVRLPRRAAPFAMLADAPWRVTRWILAGIPGRAAPATSDPGREEPP